MFEGGRFASEDKFRSSHTCKHCRCELVHQQLVSLVDVEEESNADASRTDQVNLLEKVKLRSPLLTFAQRHILKSIMEVGIDQCTGDKYFFSVY